MNVEITEAIDLLREMPIDRTWFIPVRLSPCEIPDWDIGAGATLRDIHFLDLYEDWELGIELLAKAILKAFTYNPTEYNKSTEGPKLPRLRRTPTDSELEAWSSVWSALLSLQMPAYECWEELNPVTFRAYVEALRIAVRKIGATAFFFDKDDFNELRRILKVAFNYKFSKESLLNICYYKLNEAQQHNLHLHIVRNRIIHESFGDLVNALHKKYSNRVISPAVKA